MNRLRSSAGFTLIELLVVVAIVGILTAIGVAVMGQDPKRYLFAFFILVLLAVVSYLIANQVQIKVTQIDLLLRVIEVDAKELEIEQSLTQATARLDHQARQ